jgi:hypothetical protein
MKINDFLVPVDFMVYDIELNKKALSLDGHS